MHRGFQLLFATLLVMAMASSSLAVLPSTMTVQGRLTDLDGKPYPPGEKKFRFKIFNAEVAGDEIWPRSETQEQQGVTTDEQGLWTAVIGSIIPLDRRIFDEPELWLELLVATGIGPEETLPRIRLHAGAFAFHAGVSDLAGANSVTSGAIVDGAVHNDDLGPDAVTSDKIADGAITGPKIANGAIGTDHLALNSVTGSHIADGTIGTLDIATGGVSNIDLATNSVTSDKIADGVVSSLDIATGAVGNSDLADNSVTSSKILDLSITNADLSNSCVNSSKIFDGSIVNADISTSAAISPSKINGTAATLTTSQDFTAAKNFSHNTGMGTTTPGLHKLMVESALDGVSGSTVFVKNSGANGLGMIVENTSSDLTLLLSQKGAGDVFRCDSYTGGWHPVFRVKNDGYTVCSVIELTGGSDLAEPFDISGGVAIEPGLIVAIDPENPGKLRVADVAYDRTVAGVVSGANGLNPGLTLRQVGSVADGGHPVALSGRVYCWVDADYAPVVPGDFLTSSDTPGHAMKAVDRDASYGTIIGKAMTSLEQGRGLVLVLVALQ